MKREVREFLEKMIIKKNFGELVGVVKVKRGEKGIVGWGDSMNKGMGIRDGTVEEEGL